VKSINNDLETTLLRLEENLVETSLQVEGYQKCLLLRVIKERHTEQYLVQQRRLRALKAPISTAIGAFQRIFGGDKNEALELEIDTGILDEDFEVLKTILDSLDLDESIRYFNDSKKLGLKRANIKWMRELEGQLG
jgi:hypothetical protein